ncbi:MAG TPA: peptidase, partial [Arenimonas sp.]|nr:peptidase [Arenimonas sp.]
FSTGNQVFPLPDGSALALTTAVMADRYGKIYGDSVEPDEVIWDLDGADATEAAAQKWIEAQPGCAG